jgi:hypothetical protein
MSHEAIATGEAAFRLALTNGVQYAARLAAELIGNILLDYREHAKASEWIRVLFDLSSAGGHGNTQTSLDHVRDRLSLETGDVETAANRMRARVDLVRTFGSTHGKFAELALAAALLAAQGDSDAAFDLATDALEGARALAGRPVADFIVDACLRVLKDSPARHLADDVARLHLSLRAARGPLPLAPAFSELGAISRSLAGT